MKKVLRKEEDKSNTRALARHNCHSGLDPESYPRYGREFNVSKILNQVQDDSKRNNPITNLTSYRLNVLTTLCAFTMAEILLSLTIIGVVAAITLPSLTGNINERTWNTQRKALYARMSQAIALMPALNGYGTLKEESSAGASDAVDTATETFLTDGLAKVLKINNICDSEHLQDCGIPEKITPLSGSGNIEIANIKTLSSFNEMFDGVYTGAITGENGYSYSQQNTKAVAFETINGESVLTYYNPYCFNNINETASHDTQSKMCANFIYDLNGSKGPNTVGKDIGFISVLYPSDPVVAAPLPLTRNANYNGGEGHTNLGAFCRQQDNDSRAPGLEELYAMFYNRSLLGIEAGYYWSSKVLSNHESAWAVSFNTGKAFTTHLNAGYSLRCIRR